MGLRAAVLCWASLVTAGHLFTWVDANGGVHLTDRLDKVPEPYYSMYRAELKEKEEAGSKVRLTGPPSTPTEPSSRTPQSSPTSRVDGGPEPGSIHAEQERQRAKWKVLVSQWRAKLKASTLRLAQLDERLARLRLNPVLLHTPQVKAEIDKVAKERAVVAKRNHEARQMLLEALPKRARREKVPLRWLQ